MLKSLRNFRKSEDGSATVDFLTAVPLLLMCLIFAFELGLALVRSSMLERGVDIAVRQIRLNQIAADDYEGLRKTICDNTAAIPQCEERLKLELKVVDPLNWTELPDQPDCDSLQPIEVTDKDGVIRKDVELKKTGIRQFDHATANQLVLVRACVIFAPLNARVGSNGLHNEQDTFGDTLRDKERARTGDSNLMNYHISSRSSYVVEP